MSGDERIPADDWDEQAAARAAYGAYVRNLKRQLDAKNAPRVQGKRERLQQVAELVAQGMTDEEIAEAIDREPRTVQRYKKELRQAGIL